MESFLVFLATAVDKMKVSESRMGALLTHEGFLAPLRAVAERGEGFDEAPFSSGGLLAAWLHFEAQHRNPEGSPEAHDTARSAMLGAMRQAAALLQLGALASPQQQRAVRRARKAGFLHVVLPSRPCFPSSCIIFVTSYSEVHAPCKM